MVDPRLAEMVPEPMAAYVEELATAETLPVVAIGACLIRRQEASPLLRQLLASATNERIESEGRAAQLFRALHILGGARDSLAFVPLVRLLREPSDYLEWLLGDADTETLPGIVIGVFDGNADALFEAIADSKLAGSIRGALLGAATFLAWEGRIDRQRMIAFLEQLGAENSFPGDELLWHQWAEAIALLGLRQLAPLVWEAEKQQCLDETLFDREQFEATLADAERIPNDKSRFDKANLGYIDDVVGALEQFPYAFDSESSGWNDVDDEPAPQPAINPWRHVGRNDPCPCGSGKKAKRCCLAA